jgi:peptide deformylase
MIEGCLSLPRVVVEVERPLFARVRGQDRSGEPVVIEASGHEARVLQHEIDHLNGVLILDRTERAQRRGALKALRRGESYAPPDDDQQ